jgi:hypothetical protein
MEVFPEAKVVLTIRDPENWYKSVKETIYQGNMDRQMLPVNIYSWFNGSSKQLSMMETFTHASNNRFNNGKQPINRNSAAIISFSSSNTQFLRIPNILFVYFLSIFSR